MWYGSLYTWEKLFCQYQLCMWLIEAGHVHAYAGHSVYTPMPWKSGPGANKHRLATRVGDDAERARARRDSERVAGLDHVNERDHAAQGLAQMGGPRPPSERGSLDKYYENSYLNSLIFF